MPVKALERPWQLLLSWKKAGDAGQSLGKGNDRGYCLEKRQAIHVKALEKAMTRAIALKKKQAMPVIALEEAMTRAKGKRGRSKPWKRQ